MHTCGRTQLRMLRIYGISLVRWRSRPRRTASALPPAKVDRTRKLAREAATDLQGGRSWRSWRDTALGRRKSCLVSLCTCAIQPSDQRNVRRVFGELFGGMERVSNPLVTVASLPNVTRSSTFLAEVRNSFPEERDDLPPHYRSRSKVRHVDPQAACQAASRFPG